jgi:hypothetical protein
MAVFDVKWVERWQDLVNKDGVLKVIGRHFTANILMEFGPHPYVISFVNGAMPRVAHNLGSETSFALALRGPTETWSKFVQPIPPPMYNDLIALSHPLHGRMRVEGDLKVMWQNLRALTWALDLMRNVKE